MKKCILIAIFLCAIMQAQVISTKDSLRLLKTRILSWEILNLGAAMPINDFGNKDKSSTSGFAIPGVKLDGGFNIQLYKHLGIKSQVMWQNNQINETKYKKDLIAEDPANSYTISSGGWNNFGLLIGVFGNFNMGSDVHLQPFIMGGFNFGLSPNVEVTVLDSLKMTSHISQKRGNATNFCYGGGLDLKIDLINGLQFITGVNAFYCELKYNGIRVENSYKNSIYEFNALQPVQTLGFKLGIGKIIK